MYHRSDRCDWYRDMYWRDRREQDRQFYRMIDWCDRRCCHHLDWKHWHRWRYQTTPTPIPVPTP